MFEVYEAKREQAPITAAFIGGSGSGKTYSALKFARGLVGPKGKIVIIDSEGGRANIYANDPLVAPFYRIDMIEPFTSDRFREAFKAAKQADADAIIIDTISHEHEGFLELSEKEEVRLKSRRDVSRAKWIKPKALRKRFYSAIASSSAHVIITIRLNRIVDMEQKPAKEIYRPECDKDLPYKMDLSMQIDEDHKPKFIRVPEPLIPFVQDGVMIEVEHGKKLAGNISAQPKGDNEELKRLISNLELQADAGIVSLERAYKQYWKANGPKDNPDDNKAITPARKHMQSHLKRLKQLAAEAEAGQTQSPDPEPGEIGEVEQAEKPDPDDGLFQTQRFDKEGE